MVGEGVGAGLADGGEDFARHPVLECAGLGFVRAHDQGVQAGLVDQDHRPTFLGHTQIGSIHPADLVGTEAGDVIGDVLQAQVERLTGVGRHEPRLAVDLGSPDVHRLVAAGGVEAEGGGEIQLQPRPCTPKDFVAGGRMMKLTTLIVASVVLGMGATAATAGCYEPSAPSRYSKPDKPEPPDRPFCAGTYGGKNTCSEWEVTRYNSALRTYQDDLEQYKRDAEEYVRKLKTYLADAQQYAICEVKSLDD